MCSGLDDLTSYSATHPPPVPTARLIPFSAQAMADTSDARVSGSLRSAKPLPSHAFPTSIDTKGVRPARLSQNLTAPSSQPTDVREWVGETAIAVVPRELLGFAVKVSESLKRPSERLMR
jgi:hypothetical protein